MAFFTQDIVRVADAGSHADADRTLYKLFAATAERDRTSAVSYWEVSDLSPLGLARVDEFLTVSYKYSIDFDGRPGERKFSTDFAFLRPFKPAPLPVEERTAAYRALFEMGTRAMLDSADRRRAVLLSRLVRPELCLRAVPTTGTRRHLRLWHYKCVKRSGILGIF